MPAGWKKLTRTDATDSRAGHVVGESPITALGSNVSQPYNTNTRPLDQSLEVANKWAQPKLRKGRKTPRVGRA